MKALTSRSLLLGVLLFLGAAAAQAGEAPATTVVRQTTERLQTLIRQHRAQYDADKAAFYAVVNDTVAPAFDLPYVARAVLGRHWRSASDEQRARFQAAFRNHLIRIYADTLLENGDARVEWLQALGDETSTTVKARLLRSNGAEPVALGFELHRTAAGEWKVYEITIEAISFLSNFRGQIAEEIKRNGIDAVIQRLESGAAVARS